MWKKINNLSLCWALSRSEVESTREETVGERGTKMATQTVSSGTCHRNGLISQNKETFSSKGAIVAIRIDTAKDAASTAAFEAHKTAQIVDEVKVESVRAMKVERIAKEYAEK